MLCIVETRKQAIIIYKTKRENHRIVDMIIEHTSTQQFSKKGVERERTHRCRKKVCAKIIFNVVWGRGQDVFCCFMTESSIGI